MRRVVLYTLMSLDGAVDDPGRYFAPGKELGEVPEFDSVMVDNEEQIITSQDEVLLGRHMSDEWSQFWPNAERQPFVHFIHNVKKYVSGRDPPRRSCGAAKHRGQQSRATSASTRSRRVSSDELRPPPALTSMWIRFLSDFFDQICVTVLVLTGTSTGSNSSASNTTERQGWSCH